MFAIADIQGNQYKVSVGDVIRSQKVDRNSGEKYTTDRVLLVSDEDRVQVGTPYVSGYTVEMEVLDHGKSDKIRVFKMKAKKRYRRVFGHRQEFTSLKVLNISGASVSESPREKRKGEPVSEDASSVEPVASASPKKKTVVKKKPKVVSGS